MFIVFVNLILSKIVAGGMRKAIAYVDYVFIPLHLQSAEVAD